MYTIVDGLQRRKRYWNPQGDAAGKVARHWDKVYTLKRTCRTSGGDPIGNRRVKPHSSESRERQTREFMVRQFKENSAAKNGSTRRQTRITTDVSKVVHELETRSNGKIKEPKVEVQFKVAITHAKSVSVAGTFNDWDPKKTPLQKNGEAWNTTIALPRGQYEYRFVVDGQWMADPNAAEAVPNPFGSSNSVLNI